MPAVVDFISLTADFVSFADRRCLKKTAENNLVPSPHPPTCQKMRMDYGQDWALRRSDRLQITDVITDDYNTQ